MLNKKCKVISYKALQLNKEETAAASLMKGCDLSFSSNEELLFIVSKCNCIKKKITQLSKELNISDNTLHN